MKSTSAALRSPHLDLAPSDSGGLAPNTPCSESDPHTASDIWTDIDQMLDRILDESFADELDTDFHKTPVTPDGAAERLNAIPPGLLRPFAWQHVPKKC